MKARHLWFCILIFAAGCGGGGVSNSGSTVTVPPYTLCGTQLDITGKPVEGALVSIVVNSKPHKVTTGITGEYSLTIPSLDAAYLPDTFSYSVSKNGFIPVTYSRSKTATDCQASQPMIAVALNGSTILIESEPVTHHLGDGAFSGDINSKFQYMNTQGKSLTMKFVVQDLPTRFPFATITFVHKGVQLSEGFKDFVQINKGDTTNSSDPFLIPESDPGGNFVLFQQKVPSSVFKANQSNEILIESSQVGADWDDFEFQNVVIQFSPN